jgi:lipoprotein-anchoring transpeptidase ErfK/SrfK
MRRRIALVAIAAVTVALAGIAAIAVGDVHAGADTPLAVEAPPFAVAGHGDASAIAPLPEVHGFVAGEALVPELAGYAAPDPAPGTAPVVTAANPTWEGFPLTVEVLAEQDGWLEVRMPVRPNNATYWVAADQVQTWSVPNRIVVEVGVSRLTVYRGDGDEVLFTTDVATGRPNTPTPLGDFFIDIVNPIGHGTYGWGQLSVAGFSDVLRSFGGGIGQIAIHGWNDESVMGQHASNGCVRMRNADIARVAELAPRGTPVTIVA